MATEAVTEKRPITDSGMIAGKVLVANPKTVWVTNQDTGVTHEYNNGIERVIRFETPQLHWKTRVELETGGRATFCADMTICSWVR